MKKRPLVRRLLRKGKGLILRRKRLALLGNRLDETSSVLSGYEISLRVLKEAAEGMEGMLKPGTASGLVDQWRNERLEYTKGSIEKLKLEKKLILAEIAKLKTGKYFP